jgi:urate oxidase
LIVGKDKVKLLKVHRDPSDPKKQSVVELTVQILLEGAIETSYTKADNSVVVATDSMKNTVYCATVQANADYRSGQEESRFAARIVCIGCRGSLSDDIQTYHRGTMFSDPT